MKVLKYCLWEELRQDTYGEASRISRHLPIGVLHHIAFLDGALWGWIATWDDDEANYRTRTFQIARTGDDSPKAWICGTVVLEHRKFVTTPDRGTILGGGGPGEHTVIHVLELW